MFHPQILQNYYSALNTFFHTNVLIILLRSEFVPCLTVLMIFVIFMLCHFRVYWLLYRVISIDYNGLFDMVFIQCYLPTWDSSNNCS
jgi:hypothetical protein